MNRKDIITTAIVFLIMFMLFIYAYVFDTVRDNEAIGNCQNVLKKYNMFISVEDLQNVSYELKVYIIDTMQEQGASGKDIITVMKVIGD